MYTITTHATTTKVFDTFDTTIIITTTNQMRRNAQENTFVMVVKSNPRPF